MISVLLSCQQQPLHMCMIDLHQSTEGASVGANLLLFRVGVTALPDVNAHRISREDHFVILATDGVWEFVTSREAVELVSKVESLDEACQQVCSS